MIKNKNNSELYDKMFQNGGYSGVYDLPSNQSWYYPLYKKVFSELKKAKGKNILEVGCGTGAFAEMAIKSGYLYKGFDFSGVAVKKASMRTGKPELFYQSNALDKSSYTINYDIVVCTEMLEHIENDLDVISLWKKGCEVICSIPNYDAPGQHVRFFQNSDQVFERYNQAIQIDQIFKLKKPVLPDISFKNYLRHIVWYRYDLRKLKELFGFGKFDDVGGWFVLIGKKR